MLFIHQRRLCMQLISDNKNYYHQMINWAFRSWKYANNKNCHHSSISEFSYIIVVVHNSFFIGWIEFLKKDERLMYSWVRSIFMPSHLHTQYSMNQEQWKKVDEVDEIIVFSISIATIVSYTVSECWKLIQAIFHGHK